MTYHNIQHPDITKMEIWGTLNPTEEYVRCPICGYECETFYKQDGEILGCDICVDKVDAYEEMQG